MAAAPLVLLLLLCASAAHAGMAAAPTGYELVTCGSTVKLEHRGTGWRLHSQNVQYGSGSGQTTVTLVAETDSSDSFWKVLAQHGKQCKRGAKIKCGALVRLQHVNSGKYLHSHDFPAPLTPNQEVSAFTDGAGNSDLGDNWKVECDGTYWERDGQIRLKHKVTDKYLHSTGSAQFNRPIQGQREVCATDKAAALNLWTTREGIYIAPPKKKSQGDEE